MGLIQLFSGFIPYPGATPGGAQGWKLLYSSKGSTLIPGTLSGHGDKSMAMKLFLIANR